MAHVSCSPPRAPPIQYAAPLGTRWAKETAAAGGVGAFDLPTDPKLIGPWILGECVGKGASGRVKIAKHRVTGQLAAVKILPLAPLVNSRASLSAQQAKTDKQRLGIDREITMMKLMKHPNIIRIYDVYEGAKELFLVLEYVQGGELFDFLVNRGRLPAAEALEYFKQIIYGLNYAHTFSIIHRDLKPENILIASLSPPLIKIADWGMAAFAPPSLQLETSCGSPHYASPEIVNGERYQGNATDIWSCGVILYALLTGRLPFDDKNVKTLLTKVKAGKYDMPTWIDPLAADLLSRMLVVDVARRITIPEILAHPWLLSPSTSLAGDTPLVKTPPLPPSPSTLARPLGHPSMIDPDLFASLRIIWGRHADPRGESIKRDLCSPIGQGVHAKAFYFLLGRYHEESLRTRDGITTSPSLFNELENPSFDLGWQLDLNKHLRPYDLKPQRAPGSHQRATTVVPPISGLAPPIMSCTPTVVSSRERPPSPVGPRTRSWRPPQQQPQNVPVQRARSGSTARPASSIATSVAPRPLPRRGYTFSTQPTLAVSVITSDPLVTVDLNLDLGLLNLGSEEDLATGAADEDLGADVDAEHPELPLLVAPRVLNTELQRTMDAVTERLNGLALAQALTPMLPSVPATSKRVTKMTSRSDQEEKEAPLSPPMLPFVPAAKRATKAASRFNQEDKENQSVSEGWSYVAAHEYQSGLGLGVNRVDGKKEIGSVIFLPEEAKGRKENQRKGKREQLKLFCHMTMPPLKSKRSTLSILTSPVVLNNASNDSPGSRLTSPVVGEFKGWFSNLFNWKGTTPGQQTPGTGVIYSADGLDKTRRDVGLLFEKLGVTVEGSGFTFAEGSDRGEDDFAMGMSLRCRVEEASSDGMAVKPVRFRVQFSLTPSMRLPTPLSPNPNADNLPSTSLNALLAAPLDIPLKQRANVLANRTGGQTAILLIHEKGSTSTFRNAWRRLKERYDDVSSAYPILSPSIGATPFVEQQQRFAL
ncbi:kinase-like domain-containing protein [Mycena amicta]|nr:kinase-like domain-containing protein [Mycena amicta]